MTRKNSIKVTNQAVRLVKQKPESHSKWLMIVQALNSLKDLGKISQESEDLIRREVDGIHLINCSQLNEYHLNNR